MIKIWCGTLLNFCEIIGLNGYPLMFPLSAKPSLGPKHLLSSRVPSPLRWRGACRRYVEDRWRMMTIFILNFYIILNNSLNNWCGIDYIHTANYEEVMYIIYIYILCNFFASQMLSINNTSKLIANQHPAMCRSWRAEDITICATRRLMRKRRCGHRRPSLRWHQAICLPPDFVRQRCRAPFPGQENGDPQNSDKSSCHHPPKESSAF